MQNYRTMWKYIFVKGFSDTVNIFSRSQFYSNIFVFYPTILKKGSNFFAPLCNANYIPQSWRDINKNNISF